MPKDQSAWLVLQDERPDPDATEQPESKGYHWQIQPKEIAQAFEIYCATASRIVKAEAYFPPLTKLDDVLLCCFVGPAPDVRSWTLHLTLPHIPGLALATNCQYENNLQLSYIFVQRQVASVFVAQHEFAQAACKGAPNQWVAAQEVKAFDDLRDSFRRSIWVVL